MTEKQSTTNSSSLVSVIMPCYNDGRYIMEAIQSVKDQSWKEIELIVIDDGSDEEETIQALTKIEFPRMQILHTDHIGPAAARNKGIEAAMGEYIFPLDADDLINPEYIGRAVQVLNENPNTGIVYCHADLFGEQSGKWDLPDYDFKTELLDNHIFVTAMFRRADWETVGGFCEELKAGMEDYDFWLSLLGLGREVHQFQETYFHYRIKRVSRTTHFQDNYQDVQDTYVQLYYRHKDLFQKHMDDYCLALRWNLIDQLMQNRQRAVQIEQLQAEIQELKSKETQPTPSQSSLLRRIYHKIVK